MKIDYLYYFKELVKDMNMTQTANRLFISQQTLSNYIQRVEKYYGIKLFNRTPKLELTEAGREFLNFADSILKQNTAIKNIFTDYNEDIRGTLRFGASHVRALRLLPSILPEFNEAYPNVTVELTMENSPILREKLLSDNLDLAIGLFDTPPVELNHKLLYKDQCYLCISERLLDKYFSQTTKEILKKRNIQGVDLKSFEELPIFLMNSANHIGHIIQQLFLEAGIKPDLYMSTKSDSLGPPLCSAGVAASFITHSRLLFEWNTIASDINIFPVMFHKSPLYFDLYLISPQNSRFPKYQLYFTKLILNYVQRLNLNPLSRII